MKKTIFLTFLCVLLLFAGQAYALNITPDTPAPYTTGADEGVTNSQSAINAWLEGEFDPDLVELYKAEAAPFGEEGSLAGSYTTIFTNSPSDPSGAEIYYDGGPIVADAWLLVKDGNHSPWWYLYDLAAWDGEETLVLSGFWPDGGAISHVSLYGNAAPVPEPSTIVLMGLGLVGLAGLGRRKIKQ